MGMAESSNAPVRLPREVKAVNVGLRAFAEAVRAQGGEAIEVDWAIPAGGDPELVRALTRLYAAEGRYGPANAEVLRRLESSAPVLVRVARAIDVVPRMGEETVLHPGPPLPWEAFCDPLRRSVRATVVAEGWASSPEEAQRLVDGGGVTLEPANHHETVVPMATTLGPSAPVLVVEDPASGRQAFSGINQGPGRTAWFGVEAPEAVERLVFLREAVGPILDRALRASPPVDVFSFAAQGLLMGDDAHMRTQAATNLLIRHLLPALVDEPDPRRGEVPLREPPVLPERRDGRREGRDQLGRGGGGLVDRHGDGEERDDVRDPGRGGRAVVRGPGAPGRGRPVPSRVRTGGRRAGHRRQRGPRAGGAGGGGGGGVPRGGRLRGRADRRCRGAFDGGRQDLRGSVGAVLPPPPRLPRGADRGRRPPGRGARDHPGHQHRDPARHGRHRPGGGRGRARPDDCFREALLALPA